MPATSLWPHPPKGTRIWSRHHAKLYRPAQEPLECRDQPPENRWVLGGSFLRWFSVKRLGLLAARLAAAAGCQSGGKAAGGGAGRRKRLIAPWACLAAANPSRTTRAAAPAGGWLPASSSWGCRGGWRRHPCRFLPIIFQLVPGFYHGPFDGRLGPASVAAGCAP